MDNYQYEVVIDESGNTGNNIVDKAQRFFCLSSANFSEDIINKVTKILSTDAEEYHFVNLKRKKVHQKKIIEIFNLDFVNNNVIKQSVTDKSYGTTCHLVDLLIEPILFKEGIDIYKDGLQYGYANMLYSLISSGAFGDAGEEVLHKKFVNMIRKNDGPSKTDFYVSFEKLYIDHQDKEYSKLLVPIIESFWIIDDIIEKTYKYQLDFTFASFYYISGQWTKQFKSQEFNILMDESKQITYWEQLIDVIKRKSAEKSTFSKHLSDVQFPVSVNEVKQINSRDSIDVQVIDLFASATTYALKKRQNGEVTNFVNDLLNSKLLSTITHTLSFDKNFIQEMKNRDNSMEYILRTVAPRMDDFK